MPHYKYLIVGGGMTADSAVHGIREVDSSGSIGIINSDSHPPYNRPPLSKGLWKGDALESIWRKTQGSGVELHLGREAKQLDAKGMRVRDDPRRRRGRACPPLSPPGAWIVSVYRLPSRGLGTGN